MNFAFMVAAAMLALAQPLFSGHSENTGRDLSAILLYFPAIFAMLSALYSDRSVRILRLAGYINNHLRRRLSSLISFHVWQWEVYKGSRPRGSHPLAYGLDKVRWMVFILPSLGSVGLYFWLGDGFRAWQEWFGIVVSVLSLGVSFLVMFLAEETKGVATIDEPNLDTLDHDLNF
ncbi:hypothetical protein [Streptomyces sp. NRRL S-1824]|uniref:hypothetical protein n=1 Tax=Streptomyces sp. NRRL S-1824 TaxID=1463889 RepID=UPI00131DEB09|nr:hypothetical protein [Streptomyces sp. NRRL S-1824]